MEEQSRLSALRRWSIAAATAAAVLSPAFAFASPYGSGVYGASIYNIGQVPPVAATTTPATSGSSRGGTTVQGQVKNLIEMGKVEQASALMQQYPTLFPTGTTSPVATATSSALSGARYVFQRPLQYRDRGEDVRQLQIYLNTHGATLVSEGAGSPGLETDFFGALSYDALVRFQEMHAEVILKPLGLSKGTGFFGTATAGFVNSN